MFRRSGPGVDSVVAMSGLLAGRFGRPNTVLYDLGCSLGATLFAMRRHLDAKDCRIVGVDNSVAMLERCRQLVASEKKGCPVDLVLDDIQNVELEPSSLIAMNYTLQFIPLAQRGELLQRVAASLLDGGVLVLSEKVRFDDPALQQLNTDLHHDFKRAHGYSDLEIAGKRDSLENVLLPETLAAHRKRLQQAGFSSCDVWFQCFSFASIIAIK